MHLQTPGQNPTYYTQEKLEKAENQNLVDVSNLQHLTVSKVLIY
jgi:hypothetical protein